MKWTVIAVITAVIGMTAEAEPSRQTESVSRSVSSFVDAVNKGDSVSALAHLAKDVSITEDLAPFRWTGPSAGSDWLTAMQRNGERMGISDIQMKLGVPTQVLVDGDLAYETVPGVVTLKGPKQTLQERGVLTFSLQKVRRDWQITMFAWGGSAPAP